MAKVSLTPLAEGSPTSMVDAMRALQAGSHTPTQLVQQCLTRIDEVEDTVHAWVQVDGERALAEAAYQETLRPEHLAQLPLHGIAVGIKDIIDVAGLRTRCGSALRDAHLAADDALIVTAFKLMVSFEVKTITELLQYCAGVLMLAFSAYLIGRTGTH